VAVTRRSLLTDIAVLWCPLSKSTYYMLIGHTMPSVAILGIEGCYLSCAAGFADVFQAANSHARQRAPFEWRFVSAAGGAITASNGLRFDTRPWRERPEYDIVVVPAIHYPGFKPFVAFLEAASDDVRMAARAVARGGADRGQLHRHVRGGAVGSSRRARGDDDVVAEPAVPVTLPRRSISTSGRR